MDRPISSRGWRGAGGAEAEAAGLFVPRERDHLLLPIDLPPMADLDDLNGSSFIVDRVHDTVISLADAVPFLSGELFIVWRAWGAG